MLSVSCVQQCCDFACDGKKRGEVPPGPFHPPFPYLGRNKTKTVQLRKGEITNLLEMVKQYKIKMCKIRKVMGNNFLPFV